jgi:hypothetical protein
MELVLNITEKQKYKNYGACPQSYWKTEMYKLRSTSSILLKNRNVQIT